MVVIDWNISAIICEVDISLSSDPAIIVRIAHIGTTCGVRLFGDVRYDVKQDRKMDYSVIGIYMHPSLSLSVKQIFHIFQLHVARDGVKTIR